MNHWFLLELGIHLIYDRMRLILHRLRLRRNTRHRLLRWHFNRLLRRHVDLWLLRHVHRLLRLHLNLRVVPISRVGAAKRNLVAHLLRRDLSGGAYLLLHHHRLLLVVHRILRVLVDHALVHHWLLSSEIWIFLISHASWRKLVWLGDFLLRCETATHLLQT